jgi:hypothetical protein
MMMNNVFEMMWEHVVVYPGSSLEGLRKGTHYLNQDSRFVKRELNSGPTEHEAGVLTF